MFSASTETAPDFISSFDWDVKSVHVVDRSTLQVSFVDGTSGTIHFPPESLTGIFEPLREEAFFRKAYVEYGVLRWSDDVDLSPEGMYEAMRQNGSMTL